MICVEKDKLYPWREQCTYMFSFDFRGAKQKSVLLWTRTVNHQQTAPYLQDCACQQSKLLSYLLVLTTTEYKSQVLGNKCLEQPVKYAQQHPASNRQPNTCYQQATEPLCLCSFFTASCKCSTWGRYHCKAKITWQVVVIEMYLFHMLKSTTRENTLCIWTMLIMFGPHQKANLNFQILIPPHLSL